jgi:hypothetical protein
MGSWLRYLLLHLAMVYVSVLVGLAVSAMFELLAPWAGKPDTVSSEMIDRPFYILVVASGALLGRVSYLRWKNWTAFFVWLPLACFLLLSGWSWQKGMAKYDSTWNTYFGKGCGGSSCVYQLSLTVPFYTGMAYSISAYISRKVGGSRVAEEL